MAPDDSSILSSMDRLISGIICRLDFPIWKNINLYCILAVCLALLCFGLISKCFATRPWSSAPILGPFSYGNYLAGRSLWFHSLSANWDCVQSPFTWSWNGCGKDTWPSHPTTAMHAPVNREYGRPNPPSPWSGPRCAPAWSSFSSAGWLKRSLCLTCRRLLGVIFFIRDWSCSWSWRSSTVRRWSTWCVSRNSGPRHFAGAHTWAVTGLTGVFLCHSRDQGFQSNLLECKN